jgi:hypothetical protein
MTEERNKKKNDYEKLVELIKGKVRTYNDGTRGYTEISVNDHYENHQVRSSQFRRLIQNWYIAQYKKVPNKNSLNDLIEHVDASAYSTPDKTRQVYYRIAYYYGKIYIDLGDPTWKAVEITSSGWGVIDKAPVAFIRNNTMLPLPPPVQGGMLNELQKIINCPDDHTYKMMISWLVAALNPDISCPILSITGEQGSAKSTAARLLHCLIDPSVTVLRSFPDSEQGLFVSAINSWVMSFDNVSGCNKKMSDALCRLVTGAAYTKRELYTNDGESVLKARRPIIINGINTMASMPDLVDRIITVELSTINSGDGRTDERTLNDRFHYHQPRIMGALYNAIVLALKCQDMVKLPYLPRMADFAKWVTAAEPGLGWSQHSFLKEYQQNRIQSAVGNLESNVLAQAIIELMAGRKKWQGYAKQLLKDLNQLPSFDDEIKHDPMWPKSDNALTRRLKRIATPLRNVRNIDYQKTRNADGALISLRNTDCNTANDAQTDNDSESD